MQIGGRDGRLEGRVAIVTGGATGIGYAVSTRLAALGAMVVIAGRNRPRGEAAAAAIVKGDGRAVFVATDVRSEHAVHALMETTARVYGGIDLVCNNAGIEGAKSPIETFSPQMVDELVGTNLAGVFWGMKHAMPHLAARRGGIIVNTASFVGTVKPLAHAIIYGATKAAVVSMTRSMALACAAEGIRVFAVCPWITDTPMVERLSGESDESPAEMAALNPSGQIVDPADVAAVIVGLCTGATVCRSGDALLVDSGGVTSPLV